MSVASENLSIKILEEEGRVLNAQAAKKSIQIRVAKRERDNERDNEHIAQQDAIITKSNEAVKALNEQGGGK